MPKPRGSKPKFPVYSGWGWSVGVGDRGETVGRVELLIWIDVILNKRERGRTGLALAVLEHVRLRELALVELELEEAAEEEDLDQGLGADLLVG